MAERLGRSPIAGFGLDVVLASDFPQIEAATDASPSPSKSARNDRLNPQGAHATMDTHTRKAAARRIMLQNTSRVFMQWYEPRAEAANNDQPLHVFATLFQDAEGVAFFDAMPTETTLSGLAEIIDLLPVIKPLGGEDARWVALIRSWLVDALACLREAEFAEAWMYLVDATNRLDWLLNKRKRVANTQAHRHLNSDARASLIGALNLLRVMTNDVDQAVKAVR